jgi:hypothetical protein
MSTISQHAAAVEAMEAAIPSGEKVVYLASVGDMSIYHHDSKVLPVPRHLATRYLAKRTHRLATPEEKAQYEADEQRAKHAAESRRELPISAETIAAVARAVNSDPAVKRSVKEKE